MSVIYNPNTLPKNDNLSRFAYSIDVDGPLYIQKGKMVAYYGALKFEMVGTGILDIVVKEAFNAPMYAQDFVCVTGRGKLILGDMGNDISGFDLVDANFTIKATNLLAVPSTLRCQESTLPGYLTLIGSGRLLVSSNGPPHFLEPPCKIDEQAVLGWADCPSPSYRYDYAYVHGIISAVGALSGITRSGEEKQLDFQGKGNVMVQSSELGLAGRGLLAQILRQIGTLEKPQLAEVAQAVARNMKG